MEPKDPKVTILMKVSQKDALNAQLTPEALAVQRARAAYGFDWTPVKTDPEEYTNSFIIKLELVSPKTAEPHE